MFKETIKKIASGISGQYASVFKHGGNQGELRENELNNFLEKVFPKQYGFTGGEVFDSNNKGAGQIDTIIYDTLYSYVFHEDNTSNILAPIESTYGIIETKSTLSTTTLKDAIKKIQLYNNLERPGHEAGVVPINPFFSLTFGPSIVKQTSHNQSLNIIFGYQTTIKRETLINLISGEGIDLVIIPNKYLVIGRSRKGIEMNLENKEAESILYEGEDVVAIGVLYMQRALKRIHLKGVDSFKNFTESLHEIGNVTYITKKINKDTHETSKSPPTLP